jgi:hypothetical protein
MCRPSVGVHTVQQVRGEEGDEEGVNVVAALRIVSPAMQHLGVGVRSCFSMSDGRDAASPEIPPESKSDGMRHRERAVHNGGMN